MKKTYSYCLLKYYHSQVLGEILNLGLIVYFPTINQLRLIVPKSLTRFKIIYSTFPEKTITAYIEYFKHRVNELNQNSDIFYQYNTSTSLNSLIDKEFLAADSSMLQFSDYKKAVLYSDSIDRILRSLSSTYFPSDVTEILSDKYKKSKSNKEEWIKPDLKNKIAKIDRNEVFLPRQDELSFLNELL
jgi:hypothetical protein